MKQRCSGWLLHIARYSLSLAVALILCILMSCRDKADPYKQLWVAALKGEYKEIVAAFGRAGRARKTVEVAGRRFKLPDMHFLNECIEVLKTIGSDEAAGALLEMAQANVPWSHQAAEAAAATGKPFVLDKLYDLSHSKNFPTRQKVAYGLRSSRFRGDARTIDVLCQLTKDEQREVRAPALSALGMVASGSSDGSEKAMRCILSCIDDCDDWVRSEAACGLGLLCKPDTFELLVNMLTDESPKVRSAAVRQLGCFGQTDVRQHLLGFVRDENEQTRVSAAISLSTLASPEALVALTEMVSDSSVYVRKAIAENLKPGELQNELILLKLLKDRSPRVRRQAALALQSTNAAEAKLAITDMLTHPDEEAQAEGAQALSAELFSSEELEHHISVLAGSSRPTLRRVAALSMLELSFDSRETLLVGLAQDGDPEVRSAAYRALYKVNPDRLREIVSR